jgi:isopenicillin-N epimerase
MEREHERAATAVQADEKWSHWRGRWTIPEDTIYLNHGSFGPTPRDVKERQLWWQRQLASQPMEFFLRQLEPAWWEARQRLADFVDTSVENLVFLENATSGMNVVAFSFPLGESDEVVLTDHEYGAVLRIWQRACQTAGTAEPRIARLPVTIESAEQVTDSIFSEVTDRTRLLVVSHITSPTAIILPVQQICDEARRRGIAICIDGPHAPAQTPLSLEQLNCDFYTASLHKWVSAPIGSGFLYVAPAWQEHIEPPLLSWGRLNPDKSNAWWEEFVWLGTRDPSAYLASSAAIDLLQGVGLENFRARTHYLARYARSRLTDMTGLSARIPDSPEWYGSMASIPLPAGDAFELQQSLRLDYQIEIPVVDHNGERSIRVSCHLYNCQHEVDVLAEGLETLLRNEQR